MTDDDHMKLLCGLLAAYTDLDVLPHTGPAGRVMLAAAVAGKGCSNNAIARAASMPVAAYPHAAIHHPTSVARCSGVWAAVTTAIPSLG